MSLKDHMPKDVRDRLGNLPTTHYNCMAATKAGNQPGIARPGKTRRDKSRG